MGDFVERTVVVIGSYFKISQSVLYLYDKYILDSKTGLASECVKKISEKAKVEEIQDLLGQNDAALFFYNRCTSVDDQDLIGEAFDSEDPVTVWVGAPPSLEEDDVEERSQPKNIKNKSDYEIVVVAQTKNGRPIFFKENQLKAVKFDSWTWTKKIELYR